MDLTKVFKVVYDKTKIMSFTKDEMGELIFETMKSFSCLLSEKAASNAKCILFYKKGIKYRKEFFVENYTVKDDYGLNISVNDVISYNKNPEELKEICREFVDRLYYGKIDDKFFVIDEVKSTSKGTEPAKMDVKGNKMKKCI